MGPLRLQLPEMVADEDGSPMMKGRLKVLGPDDAAQPADNQAEGLAEQKVAAEASHPGSSQAAADEGGSHTAAEEGSTGGRASQGSLPEDEVISSVRFWASAEVACLTRHPVIRHCLQLGLWADKKAAQTHLPHKGACGLVSRQTGSTHSHA